MEMRLTLDDEVSVDKTVHGLDDTALDAMFVGYSVVAVARRQLKTMKDLEVISNMDDVNLVYNSIIQGVIVVYGNLQAATTNLYKKEDGTTAQPTGRSAAVWAAWCSIIPLVTGIASYCTYIVAESDAATVAVLSVGLAAYASVFAVNSSVHSYLIVSYSNKDKVSVDLGFYYMANAMGRLVGTLGGGFLYHYTLEDFGLSMSLLVACPFLLLAALVASNLKSTAPGLGPKPASNNATVKGKGVGVRQVDVAATDTDTTAVESDAARVTDGRDLESQKAAR